MLGRYFRVGFYGASFQDLDGREFIYKEPKRTHLYAFTERMKVFNFDFYSFIHLYAQIICLDILWKEVWRTECDYIP